MMNHSSSLSSHDQHAAVEPPSPFPLPPHNKDHNIANSSINHNNKSPPKFVTLLQDNDVLLGRGHTAIHYVGNQRFRGMVRSRRDDYTTAERHRAKNAIARQIVDEIQSRRHGRFLRRINTLVEATALGVPDAVKSAWVVVEDAVAMEKCKQALRDKDGQDYVPSSAAPFVPDRANSVWTMPNISKQHTPSSPLQGSVQCDLDVALARQGPSILQQVQQLSSLMQVQQQLVSSLPLSICDAVLQRVASGQVRLPMPLRESTQSMATVQDPIRMLDGMITSWASPLGMHPQAEPLGVFNNPFTLNRHSLLLPLFQLELHTRPVIPSTSAASSFTLPDRRQRLFSEVEMASDRCPDKNKKRRSERYLAAFELCKDGCK